MTDYSRVHREINQYIPDAPEMSKAELEQAVLDSWFKGQTKYKHSASKIVEGYKRIEGGEKITIVKFRYGLRHVVRDAKGHFKKWID